MKVEFYPIKILGKPLLRFEVKKFQNNLKQCQLAKMIYNFLKQSNACQILLRHIFEADILWLFGKKHGECWRQNGGATISP